MKRSLMPFALVGLLVGPGAVIAQEAAPMQMTVYYTCDQNREAIADLIRQEVMAPILASHVEAGDLLNAGWIMHRVGGAWRRAEFMTAPDITTLLATRNAIRQELVAANPAALAEMNDICPTHDDYIWTRVTGSPPGGVTPGQRPARMSQYFQCDAGREARADELFNESMGPIFNRHVGDGALGSWAFNAHVVGGEYRRFLTMNAEDVASLYTHWGAAIADIQEEAPEVFEEFSSICSSHTDYQWAHLFQ
jgi:hypothetical protein